MHIKNGELRINKNNNRKKYKSNIIKHDCFLNKRSVNRWDIALIAVCAYDAVTLYI